MIDDIIAERNRADRAEQLLGAAHAELRDARARIMRADAILANALRLNEPFLFQVRVWRARRYLRGDML